MNRCRWTKPVWSVHGFFQILLKDLKDFVYLFHILTYVLFLYYQKWETLEFLLKGSLTIIKEEHHAINKIGLVRMAPVLGTFYLLQNMLHGLNCLLL